MSSFTNVGQMTDSMFDDIERIHALEDSGVDYWGCDEVATKAEAVVAHRIENPVEVVVEKAKTGSKKDLAIATYNSLEDKSRKAVIAALVEVGFKSSTASTYQANMKNWV